MQQQNIEMSQTSNPLQNNTKGLMGNGSHKNTKTDDEPQDLTRCRKCRILCSCETTIVALLVIGLGCGHYSNFFNPGRIQPDKNITARNQPAVASTDDTACLCLLQPRESERT